MADDKSNSADSDFGREEYMILISQLNIYQALWYHTVGLFYMVIGYRIVWALAKVEARVPWGQQGEYIDGLFFRFYLFILPSKAAEAERKYADREVEDKVSREYLKLDQ